MTLKLSVCVVVLSLCASVALSEQCNFGSGTSMLHPKFAGLKNGALEQNERVTDRKLGREVLNFMLHQLKNAPDHQLGQGETGYRNIILQFENRRAPLQHMYNQKLEAQRQIAQIDAKIQQLQQEREHLESAVDKLEDDLGFSTALTDSYGFDQIQYKAYREMRSEIAKGFESIVKHHDGALWTQQWVHSQALTLFSRSGYTFLKQSINILPEFVPEMLRRLTKAEEEKNNLNEEYKVFKANNLRPCTRLMSDIGHDAARVKQCQAYASFEEAHSKDNTVGIVYFIQGSGGWYTGITTKTLAGRYPGNTGMTSSLKTAIGHGSTYALICKPTDPSSIKPVDEVIAHNNEMLFTNTR